MSAGLQVYDQYRTPHGYEWLLRIGDPRTPPILFVPPLFEELNRTRALTVAVMRGLAAEGHGCWLPDLGGTGESLRSLETVTWSEWRQDVAAAAEHVQSATGKRPMVASIRGGCLVDDDAAAHCWWRFAPMAGRALVRDLDRASLAGGAEWAGYPAAPDLRAALAGAEAAEVAPLRVVRLETDAGAADHKVAGPALWRRSEPGMSAVLAAALAADLNQWSRACAASLTVACEGELLAATLDIAEGETGVLIVTGGSQTRIGSHRLFERLAAGLAAAGHPCLRFDRRGVGDSSGDDRGFEDMGADIAAAAAALREQAPRVRRVVGLGLCDGATALALSGGGAADAVILINPWLVEAAADAPPAAAIRSHYRAQLTSLTAWKRLLSGGVAYGKALRGLRKAATPQAGSILAARAAAGLREIRRPASLILATGDATAMAAAAEVRRPVFDGLIGSVQEIGTDSHTFAKPGDVEALTKAVLGLRAELRL